MRIKDEILNNLSIMFREVTDKDYRLERVLFHLIEVQLDIRDMLEGILGFLATYYEDGILHK